MTFTFIAGVAVGGLLGFIVSAVLIGYVTYQSIWGLYQDNQRLIHRSAHLENEIARRDKGAS